MWAYIRAGDIIFVYISVCFSLSLHLIQYSEPIVLGHKIVFSLFVLFHSGYFAQLRILLAKILSMGVNLNVSNSAYIRLLPANSPLCGGNLECRVRYGKREHERLTWTK